MKKSISIFVLLGLVLSCLLSCNNSPKELDVENIPKIENSQKNQNIKQNSEENKSSQKSLSKSKIMIFESYSEGDYPHFIFKEVGTGLEYDFRHISENNLSGLQLLIEDEDAAFGLSANENYLKKEFIVETEEKEIKDMDLNGNVINTKGLIIKSIRKNVNTNSERIAKSEFNDAKKNLSDTECGSYLFSIPCGFAGWSLTLNLTPNTDKVKISTTYYSESNETFINNGRYKIDNINNDYKFITCKTFDNQEYKFKYHVKKKKWIYIANCDNVNDVYSE